jgi:hypothetical protein
LQHADALRAPVCKMLSIGEIMHRIFLIFILFLITGCATEEQSCIDDVLLSSQIKNASSAKTLCFMKSMRLYGSLSEKDYQEKVYVLTAIDNSGGNGDSPDNAIILHNAKTINDCLRFEYLYISNKYPGYKNLTLTPPANEQSLYNVIKISNAETSHTLYFNISHCYGK